ncbi:type II toxin-antitoxin system RelE/ParE family toxin [Parapedobacter sp. 10938]|uniref:type II toxin-antitoxin system RelE/ParE family toxin n=1 Tax=Parapedobacter flavus TaxID=3110225 RepID=UPI002DB94FF4|nr:type II toxin-antitoxin system RelE/ParE family toxin [Parapedobacter sp. 10938]MEC3880973.1 type II toxin-antitoxin system RelE/ParE family toxin [Parapedobacter sp. 10938]
MPYKLRFTPESEDTYDALSSQLMERWGERFVLKFERRVSKALDTLSKTPLLYPVAIEETQVRKCIVHKNCSILYKVDGRVVTVICFWDNRQEPLFDV